MTAARPPRIRGIRRAAKHPARAETGWSAFMARKIDESIAVKRALLDDLETLQRIVVAVIKAFRDGRKVLLFGNGGSAADAQHLAAELVGKFYNGDRPGLPAIALTVNTSILTAVANDYGYEFGLARQIEALAAPGDVAIGLSTSGNSENVIKALRAAREKRLITVGLTGHSGGRMKQEVDFCLCVSSEDTPRIQEAHELVGHILCELVERELFG